MSQLSPNKVEETVVLEESKMSAGGAEAELPNISEEEFQKLAGAADRSIQRGANTDPITGKVVKCKKKSNENDPLQELVTAFGYRNRSLIEIQNIPEYNRQIESIDNFVNNLSIGDIIERLQLFKLSTQRKNCAVLRRLLKYTYNKVVEYSYLREFNFSAHFKLNMSRGYRNPYYFDYLVVVDFEATCERKNPDDYQHEIIQFPAVLIDVHRRRLVDTFNSYVKPRLQPRLSEFCMSLTGITQDIVDGAPDFIDVLKDFNNWLKSHGLGSRYTFSLVSDGFCDMGKFLYMQCLQSKVEYPMFAYQWVDIRLSFFNFYGIKWYKLPVTLELMGERFCGTLHNGLDDSKNIGIVLLNMLTAGANPFQNEKIVLDLFEQSQNDPPHKYALRTVKYLTPKDWIGVRPLGPTHSASSSGPPGPNRGSRVFHNRSLVNKENAGGGPKNTIPTIPYQLQSYPITNEQPPPRRINILKLALRESTVRANEEASPPSTSLILNHDSVPSQKK